MTVNDSTVEMIQRRARQAARHVVLPEGTEPRTIEAASRVARLGLCRVTLLGEPDQIRAEARRRAIDVEGVGIRAVPADGKEADDLVRAYRELGAARGLTEDEARHHLKDPLLWAALQVSRGRYHGFVAGAAGIERTLRAALQGMGLAPGVRQASSFTLLVTAPTDRGSGGLLIFADCALHPDPSAQDLAEIAILTARSARSFLTEPPRVALLSFSTRGSTDHPRTRKVAEATRVLQARAPGLIADGELQGDAALVPEIAAQKAPSSPVGGRANILVFPDLESADIGCQLVAGLAGAHVLGPILQGLAHPANAVPGGGRVADIVDLIAVTAVQAAATER